ncbi:Hypothetical predicted protein [Octopus vulgaris]|uniref:Uncharacterized protein n=1 Tax=Octopus vulgaris TaxID=6645 RepID=A0AA36B9R6_OCTVU|nr:Hypothetical predicted protein [Octopus vulgaris]
MIILMKNKIITNLIEEFQLTEIIIFNNSFLEESIRWLFANSKIKKAKRVIKTAAKQNRVDFERIWSIALKETSLREVSGHVNENFCNSRGSDPKVTTDDTTLKHTGTCVGKEVTKPVPSLISSKNEESKGVGFGLSVIASRIGSTVAPYFKLLAVYVPWAFGVVLGTGCTIAAVLVLFALPETKNQILPQTVEDLNKMRAEEKEKKMKIKTRKTIS